MLFPAVLVITFCTDIFMPTTVMSFMIYVSYRQQEAPDLFEWLCIEELRLCCPPGRFGPDCKGVECMKADA